MSKRGRARLELKRAAEQCESTFLHMQHFMETHYQQGHPEWDQAVELINDSLQQIQTMIIWLRENV